MTVRIRLRTGDLREFLNVVKVDYVFGFAIIIEDNGGTTSIHTDLISEIVTNKHGNF
jgi:hypothetical protein